MPKNNEFFIHVDDRPKRLFVSHSESITSDTFSPCCMTPDDVDYEMSTDKHSKILEICGMNQESFEYFIQHYGKSYRYLSFFHCQLINDFSPLQDLSNLEEIRIFWNIRADKLWNFSKNASLKKIRIVEAKKLTLNPNLLKTSKVMENVYFCGGTFNNYPMESLQYFSEMPTLNHLSLSNICLNAKSMNALKFMPALERFDFDAGMLATEEIAFVHTTRKMPC